jgi:S1-C subfamily serine protease
MERQANLEAHFRAPEEPQVDRLEFTEPPAAAPVNVADGGGIKGGQLPPALLKRIKEASVFIGVQSPRGMSSGSGFFAGEPGFVVTNAHVVDMLARNSPPPASVKVVRNKGEKNEITLPATVVAVDPDADLALLSVPKEGLPAPLTVKSAEQLQETQAVYVPGFPLGERIGNNITVNEYKMSSLKKDGKGVLDKLQIQGNMLPGNSGGPVLDANGDVVGVCVAIIPGTTINFAIPGDKVLRFMEGRLVDLTLEAPAAGAAEPRVPVSAKTLDPLGRVPKVALEFWVGPPGPARLGSRTPPKPQPGDGPRKALTIEIKEQAGRGELLLPPLPAGQAYWLQPSLLDPRGARVWMSAHVYKLPAPVEPKPARLAWQPPAERRLVLERWSVLQHPGPEGNDHRTVITQEVRLTDTSRGPKGNNLQAFSRQYTDLKEGVSEDGKVQMTTRLKYIPQNLQFLGSNFTADAQGTTQRDDIDAKLKDVPAVPKRHLSALQADVQKFLQAMEVPMPGKEVQPGATWTGVRPLPIDAAWKSLDLLPSATWTTVENQLLDVTYTYMGVRAVNGTERAVIQIKGRPSQQPGATETPLTGTALVDLATGQVVEEEVTAVSHVELMMHNTLAIKAQGTVVARLRPE